MHVHRVPSASVTASGAVTGSTTIRPLFHSDPSAPLFAFPNACVHAQNNARETLTGISAASHHGIRHRRGRMHHMQRRIASAWLERDPLWPHLPLRVFEALARAEANVPALQIRLQGWLDKGAPGASANCSRRGSQDARPR